MTKLLCHTVILLLFTISVQGQQKNQAFAHFGYIRSIIITSNSGNSLFHRLDTLKSKFIPSRSGITDYFNRDIEYGFKHRRILVDLDFDSYTIDILCRHDTIFMVHATSVDYKSINYSNYNKEAIEQFLGERNRFYNSFKTPRQLLREISLQEEYALYCGDADPPTRKGKYIEQLVDDEDVATLTDMIKSFNCETQAYGVTGLEMLKKRDYQITNDTQELIDHIKKRNSELVTCSGCLAGIVQKIYTNH